MRFSEHDLLEEIKDRMDTQNLFTKEDFYDLVDEIVEEHLASGWITEDEDVEAIKVRLRAQWPEVEKSL